MQHRTSIISGTEIDVYGNCKAGVNFAVSLFGALAAIKPLVLPGVGKKTLVYVIKTSVL